MVSTAITHAQLGNIEEANRWLSRADGYSMNSGAQQVWGQITANTILWARATVQEMTGSLQAAETGYRRAIDTYERRIIPQEEYYANQGAGAAPLGSFPQERVDLLQNLARTLTRQGRLVEAESEARKALLDTLKRRGRYASQSGGAIRSLAAVI
jgi:tetratricopeptide (TPR) repeat protein